MQIRIIGDDKFKNLIQRFHQEFKQKILFKNPKYQVLNKVQFDVLQTSNLDVAGRASFKNQQIYINACLVYNNPKRLYNIYGHELAHCYSTLFYNRNINHGKEWIDVMKMIELKPDTELKLSEQENILMQCHLATCKCLVNNQKIIHRKDVKNFSVCNMCWNKYTIR